jgi:hypothetical protein
MLVVGWTPAHIAEHYHGSAKANLNVEPKGAAGGETEFSLDEEVEAPVSDKLAQRPSFKNLVATGHFHLFGMSSFFLGLCLLGIFTEIGEKLKTALMIVPFISIVLDNLSFLATRFWGPDFAYLTAAAGAVMGLSFTALCLAIIKETLSAPEV